MKISIITPTQLQVNPNSETHNLWLELAWGSVSRQTVFEADPAKFEFVACMDPKRVGWFNDYVKPRVPCGFPTIYAASEWTPGQAAAVNAAVRASTGDVLAFLEDDDTWEQSKLEHQLPLLDSFDMVTCNQREVAEDRATWIRVNDFPTPSGWLMKRALWDELGGMDETFKHHMDTQFLGKVNAAKKRRIHLVEHEPDWGRPWLGYVARNSVIGTTTEREQLVVRTVTSTGGMARIASDPQAAAVSREEHERMIAQFGEVPW